MLKAPVAPAGSPGYAVAIVRDLAQWVGLLRKGPGVRAPYALADLPDAASWNGTTLPVSNGTGGKPTVTAINGAWTYPDGTTV